MNCISQDHNRLSWTRNHETLCIEPWGADSLRVRATLAPVIRGELGNALLPPRPARASWTDGWTGERVEGGR